MGLKVEENGEFSAEETIKLLTSNEENGPCDDTSQRFNDYEILPPFYDEEKFKRGQQFYHKHRFAMFIGKLLGLMTVISTPGILDILIHTNMSSEAMSAYKRYMATIFHMCVWYDSDFKPGSELWKSVATVKALHNSASKRSCTALGRRILQRDMGITQFGFMAYAVIRPELIGIHYATKEELEGFIHLWKVVGYIMGMDNRFNICRDSVEETQQICESLIEQTFVPNIRKEDPKYLKMANALVTGMWAMQPFLETKTFIAYMYFLLNFKLTNNNKLPEIELNGVQSFIFGGLRGYTKNLKYTLVRWYSNVKQIVTFWLMRNFPFLAYYKYGYENAHVKIYIQKGKKLS